MSTYIHRPILAWGETMEMQRAAFIFQCVLTDLSPDKETLTHHLMGMRAPSEISNGCSFWMIPASGGKDGGAIEGLWRAYREEWKTRVEEDTDIYIQWVELELGEVDVDSIKHTQMEFREEFREGLDP